MEKDLGGVVGKVWAETGVMRCTCHDEVLANVCVGWGV